MKNVKIWDKIMNGMKTDEEKEVNIGNWYIIHRLVFAVIFLVLCAVAGFFVK